MPSPAEVYRAKHLGICFGQRRVDPDPGGELEAGRCRQLGHDLQAPMQALRIGGFGSDRFDHEIIGGIIERQRQAASKCAAEQRQIHEFDISCQTERGPMTPRGDSQLEGTRCRERHESHKMRARLDNPATVVYLAVQVAAGRATARGGVALTRPSCRLRCLWRHDRRRDHLRMRMYQRGTGIAAMVAKHEDGCDVRPHRQRIEAGPIGRNDRTDLGV